LKLYLHDEYKKIIQRLIPDHIHIKLGYDLGHPKITKIIMANLKTGNFFMKKGFLRGE